MATTPTPSLGASATTSLDPVSVRARVLGFLEESMSGGVDGVRVEAVTTDGRSVTGLLAGETAETLELVVADGSRRVVPVAEIDERVVQDVSPMPAGLVRTPEELRDILAYLLSAE